MMKNAQETAVDCFWLAFVLTSQWEYKQVQRNLPTTEMQGVAEMKKDMALAYISGI
jgi:hypothetical protein